MDLTKEQDKAAQLIQAWVNDKHSDWMFTLAGFAGTGKTFLLARLIQDLKTNGQKIYCCAPTGKAASVLSGKLGGAEVITVHRLLYNLQSQSLAKLQMLQGKFARDPSPELQKEIDKEKRELTQASVGFDIKGDSVVGHGDIVIVDEASMVTDYMLADFKRTGAKVLFVGDGEQLPPIGSASWFSKRDHGASLESIQRQALDNPIIRLSMDIRSETVKSSEFQFEDCMITQKGNIDPATWLTYDQVLTGSNLSRHRINRFFRKRLGMTGRLPMKGEKMICIKNDYQSRPSFVNGVIFHCTETVDEEATDKGTGFINIDYEGFKVSDQMFYDFHCLSHYVENLIEEPREFRRELFECDYAYAITVHKSQGSEWDSVLVADDGMMKNKREFRRRWLYTAVTRAKKKLLIVQ